LNNSLVQEVPVPPMVAAGFRLSSGNPPLRCPKRVTTRAFINITLTIFDRVELVGHLPMYGVMAVLQFWTSAEEDQRLWVRGILGTGSAAGPPEKSQC
jgi:hypothetical protein